jgi:broad specificity phosphatase PhoE
VLKTSYEEAYRKVALSLIQFRQRRNILKIDRTVDGIKVSALNFPSKIVASIQNIVKDIFVNRFIFIRHGESELNILQNTPLRRFNGNFDTPLTQKGRDQASAVGRYVASRTDIKLIAAVTSTVSRTIDTARLALQELSYTVPVLDPNPLWDERSLGKFENRLASDVFQEFPHYQHDPNLNRFTMDYVQKAPGGENFAEVTERAWQGLQQIEQTFEGDVAIFTHGHLLRCLLGKIFELSPTQVIGMHIPNAHPVFVTKEGNEYVLEGELRID